MATKVAVIGAGVSGLVSLRACLQEGVDVTCYELTDHVGGLWRYRDEVEEDTASIFWSVYANTSKEMSAFSEFPPDPNLAFYPHHTKWYQYICDYAVTFGLLNYIRFCHKVTRITRAEDFQPGDARIQNKMPSPGQWVVEVLDTRNDRHSVTIYDAVMVCSGHTVYGKIPSYPGLDNFQGQKIHSSSFRKPEPFAGQRVLVVGFGNSALDIAIECSAHSKEVYLSTRRGGWINPRTAIHGYPGDAFNYRRIKLHFLNRILPDFWLSGRAEAALSLRFDHEVYGIKPNHRFYGQYPITNDFIHAYLFNGTVKAKPGVSYFTAKGAVFEGQEGEVELDTVIFGTGFHLRFPFITGFENMDEQLENLYHLAFPISLEHPTLVFIGLLTPGASIVPVAETQARWAVQVFAKKCKLPSKKRMIRDAKRVQNDIDDKFYKGYLNRIYVHGPVYTDEIASLFGVKPNLFKLFFTDPRLFWACLFGPLLPYHYRLQGPHPWKGARNAILTSGVRLNQQFQKVNKSDSCSGNFWKWTIAFIVLAGIGIGASSNVLKRAI